MFVTAVANTGSLELIPTHQMTEGKAQRGAAALETPKPCLTVRFTYRGSVIRIIGAGYWRKGRKIYES